MTVDYKQLKTFVKEAMFTGGGINEPSAPAGVPHRMPAAEPSDKEQDMGEEEVNEKYDIALAAREATEQLVEALDEPIYDGAYEHAFRASANLRKALNSLIEVGAHPMPKQRVVAPDPGEQMYSAGGSNAGNYTGGMGGFAMSMGDGAGGMMEDLAGAGIPNHIQALVDQYMELDEKEQALFNGIIAGHKVADDPAGTRLE